MSEKGEGEAWAHGYCTGMQGFMKPTRTCTRVVPVPATHVGYPNLCHCLLGNAGVGQGQHDGGVGPGVDKGHLVGMKGVLRWQ